MKERKFEYGETFQVEVISASSGLVAVHAYEINEGFLLMSHGMVDLPAPGDKGKIIFERDNYRGHWQYYKTDLQEKLYNKILKASEAIAGAERKSSKPTYFGTMLLHCSGEEFKSFMKQDINILCSSAQAELIRKRKEELGIE